MVVYSTSFSHFGDRVSLSCLGQLGSECSSSRRVSALVEVKGLHVGWLLHLFIVYPFTRSPCLAFKSYPVLGTLLYTLLGLMRLQAGRG